MYIAIPLIIILAIMLLILVLLSVYHMKVIFSFNSEKNNHFDFIIYWLHPFIKGVVTRGETNFMISFYVFNKKILTKSLSSKGNLKESFDMIKNIKFDYVNLRTSYGFKNPAITGIVCACVRMISSIVDVEDLYNNPSFAMDSDYVNFTAETEINLITTIKNILKIKFLDSTHKSLIGAK